MGNNSYISKDTKCYIEEVKKKYKTFGRKELRELFERKNNGDLEARKELIEKSLYMVIPLALECSKLGFDLDDLIQIGNAVLIRSIDNFDINKSLNFNYYLKTSIFRQYKKNFFYKSKNNELLSTERNIIFDLIKEKDNYLKLYGVEPTNLELSEKLNLDIDIIDSLIDVYDFHYRVNSLSDREDLIYQYTNDLYFDLNEIVENAELNIILNDCLNILSPEEQELINVRYGLNGAKIKKFKEVVAYYNISKQAVNDKEIRRLRRIKKALKKQAPNYFEELEKERVNKKKI